MAKLEIKLRDEVRKEKESGSIQSKGLKMSDYDFLIDGHEPSLLTNVTLSFGPDEINEATISFAVDEMDVDADFITAMQVHVKDKDGIEEELDKLDETINKYKS